MLILGSLPGPASLGCSEYYAQPRNAFWQIMGDLVGAESSLRYKLRLQVLVKARLALWDVCREAVRSGSSDAAIRPESVVLNDIVGFLRSHRGVRLICFNGSRAAELFERRVIAEQPEVRAIRRVTLPSTSPAYAAMPFQEKLQRWRLVTASVTA